MKLSFQAVCAAFVVLASYAVSQPHEGGSALKSLHSFDTAERTAVHKHKSTSCNKICDECNTCEHHTIAGKELISFHGFCVHKYVFRSTNEEAIETNLVLENNQFDRCLKKKKRAGRRQVRKQRKRERREEKRRRAAAAVTESPTSTAVSTAGSSVVNTEMVPSGPTSASPNTASTKSPASTSYSYSDVKPEMMPSEPNSLGSPNTISTEIPTTSTAAQISSSFADTEKMPTAAPIEAPTTAQTEAPATGSVSQTEVPPANPVSGERTPFFGKCRTLEEAHLAELINDYRASLKKYRILSSQTMTKVCDSHCFQLTSN